MQVQTAAKSQGVHGVHPATETRVPGGAQVSMHESGHSCAFYNSLGRWKHPAKAEIDVSVYNRLERTTSRLTIRWHYCTDARVMATGEDFLAVIFFFGGGNRSSLCSSGWSKLTAILFLQTPECWDYSCESPQLAPP